MATAAVNPKPIVLPTDADLWAALDYVGILAGSFLGVVHPLGGVRSREARDGCPCEFGPADQVPTLEDIGRLYSFTLDVESRLAEIDDYVRTLRQELPTRT